MDYMNESDDDQSSNGSNSTQYSSALSSAARAPTGPYVRIVEQPAKCGVRFRYECEGRISGAIPGASATTMSPTYPTIQVENYEGRARVIVSCVTKNTPYRAHPHNLVGKKSCKDGVCVLTFNQSTCSFTNLGILCAKRKDIRERLKLRESLRVDPYHTGFAHKSQAFKIIDLAVVRLCFQVFLEGPHPGEFEIALDPVVSDPIYDKKAMSELSIAKLSHYSAPMSGGTEVILLCDRVIKDDIQIRFFEERNEELFWEAFAEFKTNDIHKHFAISFRTPKYCQQNITEAVPVNIQLQRPSDGGTSEALPFYLLPNRADHVINNHKRQRVRGSLSLMSEGVGVGMTHVTPPKPLSMSHSLEEVYATAAQRHSQQENYSSSILPRLLSCASARTDSSYTSSSSEQIIPQMNCDFMDLMDISLIESAIDSNNNNALIVSAHELAMNEQYWTNTCGGGDLVKLVTDEHYGGETGDVHETDGSSVIPQLLDISHSTNSIKQSFHSQKHFLCI